MRTWKKSTQSRTRRLLKPLQTFPRWTFMLTWRCKISDLLPGFEPEVAKAGYDVNLVRSDQPEPAHLPRLQREKTRCWMWRKASPKHQETAGWVTIPTRPLTTKTSGALLQPCKSQEPNYHILESGSFLKT